MKKNIKQSNLTRLMMGLVIIVLVNIIASFLFTRFDLTSERRYSIAPATRKLVKNLNDVVFFKVYLEGDLPPGFRRLANETKEMLDEFHAYSNNIQYQFVNPVENTGTKDRNEAYRLLVERGLQPTDLRVNEKGHSARMIIFPGAIVSYKGHEVPVQLLQSQLGQDPSRVLNTSIQSLEYNLASAIQKLTQNIKPRIAFLEGQGELSRLETIDAENALAEFYNIDRITLNHKINSLTLRLKIDSTHNKLINKYRAIIIAKPIKPFDEKDKFLIDQYIMRGGKVFWLIDPVFASMDSLQKYNSTMGITQDLNLEDMLFAYGVRLNNNLVLDIQAMPIPVKTGQMGDQPQFEFFPWYYFPIMNPGVHHPIVNGLNAVKTEFISSLDTVEGVPVKKTILLTSSPYSRLVNTPALIDLDILKNPPDERMFNKGPQPVAVLVEGEFVSDFQFRIPPELAENQDLQFNPKSVKPSKMVIVGDGDIIKNQFNSKGYPLALGYDQYTRKTFGNRDFVLNVMNYLTDESGLIAVRNRELKLRSLDITKAASQKLFWQLLNTLLPILIVLVFGVIKYWLRKRKYTRSLTK